MSGAPCRPPGAGWQIFLIIILLGMISSGISAIGSAITGSTCGPMMNRFPDPIVAGLTEAVAGSLMALITAVVLAALYSELRGRPRRRLFLAGFDRLPAGAFFTASLCAPAAFRLEA